MSKWLLDLQQKSGMSICKILEAFARAARASGRINQIIENERRIYYAGKDKQ